MTELSTFEALNERMGQYTHMDTELPFGEFRDFYQSLMDYLLKNYQDMSQDDLVKAKGMCMIVSANAKGRAMRKDENRKKFTKMSEKASFWENAIKLNLTKGGMSEDELNERVSQLWADDEPASEAANEPVNEPVNEPAGDTDHETA